MTERPQTKAFRKLDEILAFGGWDPYTMNALESLRTTIRLMPMREVLAAVPGTTIGDKAKRIGVSRNTWYCWFRGDVRPTKRQAQRVGKVTGIDPDKFQGRR
jgi:hypothetical protein